MSFTAALLSHADESFPAGTPYNEIIAARVDKIVADLKKEDFDRSVDQLLMGSGEQFSWPGFPDGSAPVPTVDLELMLSNRRDLKILNHLQELSERDKAPACEALFARALQVHTNLFSTWVAIQADPKIHTKSSVENTRLTVLLAMFATADRGDRALLAKQFEQLDRFQDEARRIIAAQPPKAKADLSAYFPLFFPQQNRSLLNLLQLAADRQTNRTLFGQVERELDQAKMAKSEVPIVPWNARITYFEALPVGGEVDSDKHVTVYKLYDWTGAEKMGYETPGQVASVKKLRAIVLP